MRIIGPGVKRCADVLSKETHRDYYTASDSARGRGWTHFCDSFFLWLDTARRTGAAVTRQTWGLALPQLGTVFTSAIVHSTLFGPTQFDGAADYRVGRYYGENKACGCYKALLPDYFPLPPPS